MTQPNELYLFDISTDKTPDGLSIPTKKKCWECRKSKICSQFYKSKSRADGLQGMCRACQKAKYFAYKQTEKHQKYHREYARKRFYR